MFVSYIISALRNLRRHLVFSGINIGGLAVGLACVLLIVAFVKHEFSYDGFWPDADRIYRLQASYNPSGREPVSPVRTTGLLAELVAREVPQITAAARFAPFQSALMTEGRTTANTLAMIDPEFLDIFALPVIAGSFEDYRRDRRAMLISRQAATALFGSPDAALDQVVETLFLDVTVDFRVAAVIEDLPDNSHLLAGALVPLEDYGFSDFETKFASWFNTNNLTYFKINETADRAALLPALADVIDRHGPRMRSMPDIERPSEFLQPSILNIRDIHLYSTGHGELKPPSDIDTVRIFSAAALLILLIAGLNFANLSTARSTVRAKEVAMRRISGASRRQLIAQFLSEAVLLSLGALTVALAITEAVSPMLSSYIGRATPLEVTSDPFILLTGILMAVGVGAMAGLYPAIYLSTAKPSKILRGGRTSEPPTIMRMRAALVLFQFVITIALMGITAVIFMQVDFVSSKDLGFNANRILVLRNLDRPEARAGLEGLERELSRLNGIDTLALASQVPGDTENSNWTLMLEGGDERVTIGKIEIDERLFPALDVNPVAGRNFSRESGTDMLPDVANALINPDGQGTALINMAAVRALGIDRAEDAIGRTLLTPTPLTIVGVVPDLHFYSLKKTIRPEMYLYWPLRYRALALRYDADTNEAALLRDVEAAWSRHVRDLPMQYSFLDSLLDEQYGNERRQAQTLITFSGLAVLIACLGLYGMASFVAERRTREIGIRKVFGATIKDIVRLLIWQMSRPIAWANLFAWPVALYVANQWLMGFSYRIDLWQVAPLVCLAVMAGVFLLSWAAVGGHAVRVARTSPIRALRQE